MVEWLINPFVVTSLLTIAGIGMVIELFSPKFGLAGLIGMSALLLFFYSHFQAGYASYGSITLFAVGIILIFLEIFLPGAIAGTIGAVALVASLFLAGGTDLQMGLSLLIAIFFSIVTFFIMIKLLHRKVMLFDRMVLTDSAKKEDGYVSNVNRTDLLEKQGVTLTTLRPAGTALIQNERVDVVSEASFIPKNVRIKVVKVEGARIVVREVK